MQSLIDMIEAMKDAGVEPDTILNVVVTSLKKGRDQKRHQDAERQARHRGRRPDPPALTPELIEVQGVLVKAVGERMRWGEPFNARSLGIHPRGIRSNPRR